MSRFKVGEMVTLTSGAPRYPDDLTFGKYYEVLATHGSFIAVMDDVMAMTWLSESLFSSVSGIVSNSSGSTKKSFRDGDKVTFNCPPPQYFQGYPKAYYIIGDTNGAMYARIQNDLGIICYVSVDDLDLVKNTVGYWSSNGLNSSLSGKFSPGDIVIAKKTMYSASMATTCITAGSPYTVKDHLAGSCWLTLVADDTGQSNTYDMDYFDLREVPTLEDTTTEKCCNHIHPDGTSAWKHYQGIMNSFDFCEICDAKKNKQ